MLIRTVSTKMGGGASPMSAMLMGMMPLIRQQLGDVESDKLRTLANVMAQAFEKVSDDSVSEAEFDEWLQFE